MITTVTLKTAPELRRIVLAAFPSYRKTKAYLAPFRPTNINSYWDGGSRTTYALVDMATGRTRALPTSTHPYYDVARVVTDAADAVLDIDHVGNLTLKVIPPNCALVSAGTFCGNPATAHIQVNADNLTPLLGHAA